MLKGIKRLLERNSLILAIIVTISIALLSLIKLKGVPLPNISYIDKIEHAIAYFVLAFLWLVALGKTKKAMMVVFVSCVIYGIIIEVLQMKLTTYRFAEYADAIANTMGILLAMLSYCLIFVKKSINP